MRPEHANHANSTVGSQFRERLCGDKKQPYFVYLCEGLDLVPVWVVQMDLKLSWAHGSYYQTNKFEK